MPPPTTPSSGFSHDATTLGGVKPNSGERPPTANRSLLRPTGTCGQASACMILNDRGLPVDLGSAIGKFNPLDPYGDKPGLGTGTAPRDISRHLKLNGVDSNYYLPEDIKSGILTEIVSNGHPAIVAWDPRNNPTAPRVEGDPPLHAIVVDGITEIGDKTYYVVRDPHPYAPYNGRYLKPQDSLDGHIRQIVEALPDGQKPDPRYDPQRKAAGGQFPPNDSPNRPRDKSVSNNPNDPNNQTNDPGGEKVTGGDVSTNNNGEDGGNKTTEEPGTKTSEEPGTKAPEEPGTKTTEEAGTKTIEEPATKTSEEPGTKTPEEPGTKTTEEPGTKTSEQPSTKTNEEPGTKTPEERGTKTTEEPGTKISEEPVTKNTEDAGAKTTDEWVLGLPKSRAPRMPGSRRLKWRRTSQTQ